MKGQHPQSIRELFERYPGEKRTAAVRFADTADDGIWDGESRIVVIPEALDDVEVEAEEMATEVNQPKPKPLGSANSKRNRADLIQAQLTPDLEKEKVHARRVAGGIRAQQNYMEILSNGTPRHDRLTYESSSGDRCPVRVQSAGRYV